MINKRESSKYQESNPQHFNKNVLQCSSDYKQKNGWYFQCKYGCRLFGWFDGRRVKFFPDYFYFCSDATEGQDGLKGKEMRTYVVIEGKSPG